jgi:hypothetical protein
MALTRQRLLQTKVESSYGVDSSPAGTDAVLVRSLEVTPLESEMVSRDLVRNFMGNYDQLLANTRVSLTFEAEIAGSGAAATASRLDSLLRACGLEPVTTSTAVTGSAQAGSAGSITLASGASSADNAYRGMAVTINGGTGNGHKGLIVAYNGTTKVATVKASTATFVPGASSAYVISANTRYLPLSNTFQSTTIYFNNDGVLHKCLGCRGNVALNFTVSEVPVFNFTFTGIYSGPTDTGQPTTTYSNQTSPVLFKAGNSVAVSLFDYSAAKVSSLSVDLANETTYRELVNASKEVLLVNRAPTGEAVIEATTIAQKDWFTVASSNTLGLVSLQHGTTAGNIVSLVLPSVDLGGPSYSDDSGIQMLNMPLTPLPTNGNDEFVLTFQ